jgi:hypothetical protein
MAKPIVPDLDHQQQGGRAMAFNPLTAAQLESLRQMVHEHKNHSEDTKSEHSVALGLIKSFYKASFLL